MLACFGLYLAATGLLEAAHQWAFVFPRYIADPTVGLHYGRARGPMVQAVSYGLCLGITMLAGFRLAILVGIDSGSCFGSRSCRCN